MFKEIKLTNIKSLINSNAKTLCGIFLTRYCHTLNPNGIFHQTWSEIQKQCNELGIHNSCLITPSNGYMMPRDEKVTIWKDKIINYT